MKKSFVVVGAGRVGTAMAKALSGAGYRCMALFGRNPARLKESADFVGTEGFTEIKPEIISKVDIVFVAVPDDFIREISIKLAKSSALSQNTILAHFSGLLTFRELETPAIDVKGKLSMHPNLAFADYRVAVSKIPGTYFGIEGDEEGKKEGKKIVEDVGGIPVEINTEGKSAYHLAAVFASNGMVALSGLAKDILLSTGVSESNAQKIISTLMLATAFNIHELGTLRALTGPVVRGDTKTVLAHIEAMKTFHPELTRLYGLLFRKIIDLGIEAGRGTPEKYLPVTDLLEKCKIA